jgi:hypothetical protein
MKREVGPEIAEDGKGCATTPTGNESSLLKEKKYARAKPDKTF